MILKHFRLNPIEVNTYIFGCSETKEVMIVDLGEWDERIPTYVEEHGLKVTKLFITHDHHDHTDAVQDAIDTFGCRTISGTPCWRRSSRAVRRPAAFSGISVWNSVALRGPGATASPGAESAPPARMCVFSPPADFTPNDFGAKRAIALLR